MVASRSKFKQVKVEGKAKEYKRMVVSHKIGGKYFPEVRPGKSSNYVIVHDINNVVPVYKFVVDRWKEGKERGGYQQEDLPIQQIILFVDDLLFDCHDQTI